MNYRNEIAKLVFEAFKSLGSDEMIIEDIYDIIETPSDNANGDYSFPCYRAAKALKKPPVAIAGEILGRIAKPGFIAEIRIAGAYLNFYLDKVEFVKNVLEDVLKENMSYGRSDIGAGKTIVIDYSSPNIAKPFHPGHLRTTLIGAALYNLFDFLGYKCVGINYLGDWGTQFGKMITAYKLWGDDSEIEKNGIDELTRLYVKFHKEAELDPAMNDAAREWLLKMQNGDEEALGIWKRFFNISMVDFNRIYDKLGVSFDYYRGESYYNDKMGPVVDELKEKGLLVESDGAMIVDLSDCNMPPCLILRRDGGTLYPTRDIAAAFDRKKTFDFYKSLYVTALDQNLHFSQWMKVMEKMGYDWAKDMVHISYGLVSFESGKLSTRQGNVIKMEELLDDAIVKTLEIIEEKNPDLEDKQKVAAQIGIGAIKFNDMYNSRIKDVEFSWNRLLNFEGETGPYVQYAYARACSILRKADVSETDLRDFGYNTSLLFNSGENGEVVEIARLLYFYPERVAEAASKYEPFIITRLIVKLAQSFNAFYHNYPILNAEPELRKARLAVCVCVKTVIASGLKLLGIEAPDRM